MIAVTIVKEETPNNAPITYRAIALPGDAQATGRTAGEALDALNVQMGGEQNETLTLIQQTQPDLYFNAAQIQRLQELTERARLAPDALTPEEDTERYALIKAELMASAQRTADLADALGR